MTEGGHSSSHRHFKTILAVLLIAGILGMIAYGNAGKNFLEVLKSGKVTDAGGNQGKNFGISLTTAATSLYGKSFSITSSPFSVDGVCSIVQVGGINIEPSETRCSAIAENFTGKFDYTAFGSVVFTGAVDSLKFDLSKYSAGSPLSIQLELIPTRLSVAGIISDKLSITAPSGKIDRYGSDGSLKGSEALGQNPIDINNLLANVALSNGELKITGTANSVKSDDFSW